MKSPVSILLTAVGFLFAACALRATAWAEDIVTVYEYDNAGQVTRQYVQAGTQPTDPILSDRRTEYNILGQAFRTRELANPETGVIDNDNDRIQETVWDVAGNVILDRRKYKDSPTGYVQITYEYDDINRRLAANVDSHVEVLEEWPDFLVHCARTTYGYDGRGNVTTLVDPAGNLTCFAFDAAGQMVQEVRYEGDETGTPVLVVENAYDSRGNRICQVEWDPQTDTDLTQQRWYYDTLGRLEGHVQMAAADAAGDPSLSTDRATFYVYEFDTKRLKSVSTYAGDGTLEERKTQYQYDGLGRKWIVTDPEGNTQTLTYVPIGENGEGQIQTKTLATYAALTDPHGVDVHEQVFEYSYDGQGRRSRETAKGKGNTPDLLTLYDYDDPNRIRTVTNPNGIVTQYTHNAFGDLKKVVEDFGGLARTTEMQYDQLGRLVAQIAHDSDGPAQQTIYTYDLMDRRTSITFPDGSRYTYVYDAAGRMTSRTDPRGQVTTYTHNWRGQPLTKTVDGVLKESFSYYPTGWMQAAWMDTATEAEATNKSVFTCDAFGQTRTVTQTVDGVTKTITSDFYPSGDRKKLTYPADVDVALAYSYDDLGQTTQITRQVGAGPAVTLANYTYAGRYLTSRDITTASATETHIRYEVGLDAHRRPVRLANKTVVVGTTTVLDQTDYTFDANGNRTSARITAGDQRLTQTAGNGQQNDGYSYDPLDRLIAAVYPAGAGSETFAYDLLGNRRGDVAGYTDRAGRQSTYVHNSVNEYTSITVAGQAGTPVHDDAGNLTCTESGYGLAYDYENRPVRVYEDANRNGTCEAGETVLAEYTYDALGHRVKQVKDGQTTRYYYDGETVLAEYDGSDNLLRYHVHGPTYIDEHVLTCEAGQGGGQPQEYYYLLTHLYSVSGLADASGVVVERYRYDAYGTPTHLPGGGAFGDFNSDGRIDLRDFLIFQAAYSGDLPCSEAGRICDYNGDGKVNLADYRGFDIARRGTGSGGSSDAGSSTGGISPFCFTGQPLDFHLTDGTTGRPTLVLYHYRARAYDAYHGRFLQRDPAEYEDGMNPYEYVRSQPLTASDPTGEFSYGELGSAFSISMALESMKMDTAVSLLGAIRGLTEAVGLRNQMLTAISDVTFASPDSSSIDFCIAVFTVFQEAQSELFAGGAIYAGAKFAVLGSSAVVRRGGHHTLAKWAGGHEKQLLAKIMWGAGKGQHPDLEQIIRSRMMARFKMPIGGNAVAN